MNSTLQKAVYVILISFGLAVMFNYLFFGKFIGISVAVFTVTLLVAVFLFGLRNQVSMKKQRWLMLLIAFFAFMPSVRANEFLTFLNVCATFGLLMLLAHDLVGTPIALMKLRDYILLVIFVPFRMFGRVISTVVTLGQIHSSVKNRDVWIRALKGSVLAVPILIIFGALFSQADLAFSQFLKGFVNVNITEFEVKYLTLLAFAFVATLSFLSYIFFPQPVQPGTSLKQEYALKSNLQSGKGIEVLVFLGLIATLFLVFIGFQVTYLFGGEANIIHAGFTYAEYARRGFWELLVVAIMSLVILLASEKYAKVESKRDIMFLIPSIVLIVEVIIVIAAAFKRLSLYIHTYGMTTLRFYVAAFIVLLLVLFIILAFKFIKCKQEQFFFFGTLISVITFLVVVNIINPDAYIMRSNIEQFNRTGKVDTTYIEELSVDATSGKIELYSKLEGDYKEDLLSSIIEDKGRLLESSLNWQSANLSRYKALNLLKDY